MDFTLNMVDKVLMNTMTSTQEFYEFCSALDELGEMLVSDLCLEAVEGVGGDFKRTREKIVKNTADTTRQTVRVYGDLTDAGGGLIKGWWDLLMKLVSLAAKVIKFVFSKIGKLPKMIMYCMDKVGDIPKDIRDKIRGNIKLYVTVDDIRILYSNNLMGHIIAFCDNCKLLSEGNVWRSAMELGKGSRAVERILNMELKDSDKTLSKNVLHEYNKFKAIKLSESRINMDDPVNVKTYFGMDPLIQFVDIKGKPHKCNYYDALRQLITDLNDHISGLDQIREDLSNKFETAELDQSFAKLSERKRALIMEAIQAVAKGIEVIGNLVRYIQVDVNTIQATTDKIISRSNNIKNGKVKKLTKRDAVVDDTEINKDAKLDDGVTGDLIRRGYVKVERYPRDKNGKVLREVKGIIDDMNNHHVWIPKNEMRKDDKPAKN